jgi:hypothetical protein
MARKPITLQFDDECIKALEKYAKENCFERIEDVAIHAIITLLQRHGYLL